MCLVRMESENDGLECEMHLYKWIDKLTIYTILSKGNRMTVVVLLVLGVIALCMELTSPWLSVDSVV